MDIQDEIDEPTQTSAAGLTRLASTIGELLREPAIDSRFGTKLHKRLEKEAKRVAEKGPAPLGKAQKAALKEAIAALEHALVQRDADLLVQANARLRDSEAATAVKRQKGEKGRGLNASPGIGNVVPGRETCCMTFRRIFRA